MVWAKTVISRVRQDSTLFYSTVSTPPSSCACAYELFAERLVAEANLSFALNTRLFALVPPPKPGSKVSQIKPVPADADMTGALLLVPGIIIGFALSWAFGWYAVPELRRLIGL